jgi:hypothetical protein
VPISKTQSAILRVLAAQRSPDSYIAGGVPINRDGPRFSQDIDIFQDSLARLESAVAADEAALKAAGYTAACRLYLAFRRALRRLADIAESLARARKKARALPSTRWRQGLQTSVYFGTCPSTSA